MKIRTTFVASCLLMLIGGGAASASRSSRGDDRPAPRVIEVAAGEDEEALHALLRAGANPNARDRFDETALMTAARNGRARMIHALLEAGADPNARTPHGDTALMLASNWAEYDFSFPGKPGPAEHLQAVRALLAGNAQPDRRNRDGLSALMVSAMQSRSEIVEALLTAGASASLQDRGGRTALTYAAEFARGSGVPERLRARGAPVGVLEALLLRDWELASLLIRAGRPAAATGPRGETTLMVAAEAGQAGLVRLLLKRHPPLAARDQEGDGVLIYAIGGHLLPATQRGGRGRARSAADPAVLAAVLGAGVSPQDGSREAGTALTFAAGLGDDTTVETLLRAGADPRRRGRFGETALGAALRAGHMQIARRLVAAGIPVNEALADAAAATDSGLLRYLLEERHADANSKGHYGVPLLNTVAGWSLQGVDLLLSHGARVDARDRRGETALMAAAGVGRPGVLERLLSAGAAVNERDHRGVTALMHASEFYEPSKALRLLEDGAEVNAADRRGITPLMAAANGGHLETVRLLLAHGADPLARVEAGVRIRVMQVRRLHGPPDGPPDDEPQYREPFLLFGREYGRHRVEVGGWTALDFAAYKGFKEMEKLLGGAR